ncbi:MAG: peptidase T, partial [Anaerolineales bacterium]
MSSTFLNELEERLLRYVKIDTTADPTSPTTPSTQIQFDLLHLLMDELKEIGVQDISLTSYGAVLATIPATADVEAPTIALLAHVDTAPQFSGTNVKPIVHHNYNGEQIVLPDDPSLVLSPKDLPYLEQKVGDDIVTASGTTLLGADDKAGVAIIMTAMRHLLQNPELPHGPIRIGFTPDE